MSEPTCTYPNRQEVLTGFLYDDLTSAERTTLRPTASRVVCAEESEALGKVRTSLQHWAPPEPARALSVRVPAAEPRSRMGSVLRDIPAWAQVAAALLFLGVAAGIANLHITIEKTGVSVRTGWSSVEPAERPVNLAAREQSVSREEFAALAAALRQEIGASASAVQRPVAATLTSRDREKIMQEVERLVAENNQQQNGEVARVLAGTYGDWQNRRKEDLRRVVGGVDQIVSAMRNASFSNSAKTLIADGVKLDLQNYTMQTSLRP